MVNGFNPAHFFYTFMITKNLSLWGITTATHCTDILLPGSPERCVVRTAIKDETGQIWMLEQLHPGQFDRRERIGRIISILASHGIQVPAYLPGPDGRFVVEHEDSHWQLSPYIHGDLLPQPAFVDDAERGKHLGNFIADLRLAGSSIEEFDIEPPFVLEDYVNKLIAAMRPHRPEIHDALSPVLGVLAPLFEAWHDLPVTLCHGDFHPLNVIWKGPTVAAVIDWEFCGMRPALFDVSNCLGCVAIEDPLALVKGLAPALLRALRDTGCLDETSLSLLPEMILGMRFAWMSEWLRKQDADMIELETRFMRLMANSLDTLLPAWNTLLAKS